MLNRNKSIVELVRENPTNHSFFYTELELPATYSQMEDALQKARWTNENGVYKAIHFINCPFVPDLVDIVINDATIMEMNFVAKRLEKLPQDELIVLNGIIRKNLETGKYKYGLSMKELINQTYGLDSVMIASYVDNDEKLGEFVIENGLHQDIASIPDNALYLLDKKQVGKLQRENDGGIFMEGYYIVAGSYELPEIYDGKHLPEIEEISDAVFRLEVCNRPTEFPQKDTVWIELPSEYERLQKFIKECFHGSKAEDCIYYGFESAIPMIDEGVFEDMKDLEVLNNIAMHYKEMPEMERIKYKAVLEAEPTTNIKMVLDVAEHISEYELAYECSDPTEFFMSHLMHHMDNRYDSKWIANLLVENEGSLLLERLHAKCTGYGIISARGGSLYSLVSYEESEEAMHEEIASEEELEENAQCLGGMPL